MTQFENHHLGLFIEAGAENVFRIGYSEVGGPDPIGSSSVSWPYVSFSEFLTEATIDNGISFNGLETEYDGNNATITLFNQDADPLSGYIVKVGSKLKLTLENYVPSVSSQPFYVGVIKGIERIIDDNGFFTTRITAGDELQQVLSKSVDYLESLGPKTAYQRFQALQTAGITDFYLGGLSSSTAAQYQQGDFVIDADSISEFVNETMLNEAGWLFATNENVLFPLGHADLEYIISSPTTDIVFNNLDTDGHIAISHINQDSNTNDHLNSVRAEDAVDPLTFVTAIDQDSIDLYGRNHQDVTLNLIDAAEMQKWVDLAMTRKGNQRIKGLSVDAVAHKNRKLHDVWKLYPSSPVQVQLTMGTTTINEYYLVSRVIHNITADVWTTDVELWRNI